MKTIFITPGLQFGGRFNGSLHKTKRVLHNKLSHCKDGSSGVEVGLNLINAEIEV